MLFYFLINAFHVFLISTFAFKFSIYNSQHSFLDAKLLHAHYADVKIISEIISENHHADDFNRSISEQF